MSRVRAKKGEGKEWEREKREKGKSCNRSSDRSMNFFDVEFTSRSRSASIRPLVRINLPDERRDFITRRGRHRNKKMEHLCAARWAISGTKCRGYGSCLTWESRRLSDKESMPGEEYPPIPAVIHRPDTANPDSSPVITTVAESGVI